MSCATCKHSVGTEFAKLWCWLINLNVERNHACPDYEREPGAEG